MPKERFEVGEREKHFFTFDGNVITKRIKIEQDGLVVVNEFRIVALGKKYEFDVGISEKHHVEIAFGWFRLIELKVDGQKVHPLI